MITAQTNGAKQELTYKLVHEQSPLKPGVVFWLGAAGETFYWHDLLRASYDPNPDDDEPEERIILLFRLCDITIQGHALRELYLAFQTCRIDWVKVSSPDAIMRGNGTIITDIQVKEPKKKA